MGMPKEVKQEAMCLFLMILMVFLLFLAIYPESSFPSEPPLKTFTLTINSQQVIVNLPKTLPNMETSMFVGEECFNLKICRQQFCLSARAPGHDHVDFVFTDKEVIIALVWIRTMEQKYVVWKYVNGLPIISTIDEIKAIILGDKQLKKT